MLIVTRNLQQSVILGEFDGLELAVKVTVLGVRGKKVRLGIDVLSGEPDAPSESWEQLPNVQPSPAAKPGMATTQEVDWDWEEDGKDETIDRKHGPAPRDAKKRISSENQTDQ